MRSQINPHNNWTRSRSCSVVHFSKSPAFQSPMASNKQKRCSRPPALNQWQRAHLSSSRFDFLIINSLALSKRQLQILVKTNPTQLVLLVLRPRPNWSTGVFEADYEPTQKPTGHSDPTAAQKPDPSPVSLRAWRSSSETLCAGP